MTTYTIHYRTPGMMTFAPMFEEILAKSLDEALEIFRVTHPGDIVISVEEDFA